MSDWDDILAEDARHREEILKMIKEYSIKMEDLENIRDLINNMPTEDKDPYE